MPQRIRDVFAWVRLFMSAQGPSATTRLVLFAHSQFMDRDGSRCRVGVRHLAEATGLNKTTVAEHRSLALRLGWLIGSKPSRGRGSGELYPAAPDGVKIVETGQASGESGQAPNPPIEVSGLNPETVRNEPQNCPAIPDVPPIPIKPLREKLNAFRKGMSTEARRSAPSREGLKEQLRNWLENDETVKQYLRIADIEAIIKLTPERLRVSDYEEQILNLIEEIALGGAA